MLKACINKKAYPLCLLIIYPTSGPPSAFYFHVYNIKNKIGKLKFKNYLLFFKYFCLSCTLFSNENILTCLQLFQISCPLIIKVLVLEICFLIHLVYQLSFNEVLHPQFSLIIFIQVIICLFWTKVRLIIQFFNVVS